MHKLTSYSPAVIITLRPPIANTVANCILCIHVQVLRKKVAVLESTLREKERETELLLQVAPGSSRETQLLRRQIVKSEEHLSQKELRCRQLEEVGYLVM